MNQYESDHDIPIDIDDNEFHDAPVTPSQTPTTMMMMMMTESDDEDQEKKLSMSRALVPYKAPPAPRRSLPSCCWPMGLSPHAWKDKGLKWSTRIKIPKEYAETPSKIYTLPYSGNISQFRQNYGGYDDDDDDHVKTNVIIEEIMSDDDNNNDDDDGDDVMQMGDVAFPSSVEHEERFPLPSASTSHRTTFPHRNKRRLHETSEEGAELDADVGVVEQRLQDIGISPLPKKRRVEADQYMHD